MTRVIRICNQHSKVVNIVCWVLCSLPAIYLGYCYLTASMGINPFEFLMNVSGHCAVIMFIISYAIVPIRRWATALCRLCKSKYGKRLSDWNFLIYNRRMVGLNAFYYAAIHLFIYLYFEVDFDLELFISEFSRYFIVVGWVAIIILSLLALTSPKPVQRKLKKKWKVIHRSVDLLAILLPLHVFLQSSIADIYTWTYITICALLAGHRIIVLAIPYFFNAKDDGEQVFRR